MVLPVALIAYSNTVARITDDLGAIIFFNYYYFGLYYFILLNVEGSVQYNAPLLTRSHDVNIKKSFKIYQCRAHQLPV